jgi:hypothetical protein
MQNEPEDALDQALTQSWQLIAQSLRQTGMQINNDIRRLKQSGNAKARADASHLEQKRNSISRWRYDETHRIDDGFARTLNATILDPRMREHPEKWDDTALVKSWVVADQISDGKYLMDKETAKHICQDEYAKRHPGENIAKAADALTTSVTIHVCDPADPDFEATKEAFRRGAARVDIRTIDPADVERFRNEHDGKSFSVDAGDRKWNGMDRERLTEAVLTSATADPVERIMFLKSHLPESAPADNTATGMEPESPREFTQNDNTDAAPVQAAGNTMDTDSAQSDKPDTGVDASTKPVSVADPLVVEKADESLDMIQPAAPESVNEPSGKESWPGSDDPLDGGRNPFGWFSAQELLNRQATAQQAARTLDTSTLAPGFDPTANTTRGR